VFSLLSNRWNCPAINYKFAAGNGGSSFRCKKCDEFCNLIRPVGTAQGNHEKSVNAMFDQVIAWGGALKALREK